MKIDPYYQQQRCRLGTLVSSNIMFMWILVVVHWTGHQTNSRAMAVLSAFTGYVSKLLNDLYSTKVCAGCVSLITKSAPRVGFGVHVCYHCRISPPRFLAECHKRRLNQGSFVLLFFGLFTLSDLYLVYACLFPVLYLYLVCVCLFSCTALFVSISQVIGCEDRLRNDLLCVGWGVKLYSLTPLPITKSAV